MAALGILAYVAITTSAVRAHQEHFGTLSEPIELSLIRETMPTTLETTFCHKAPEGGAIISTTVTTTQGESESAADFVARHRAAVDAAMTGLEVVTCP